MAELLHRTMYFLGFYETKLGGFFFGEFIALATLGVKGLIMDFMMFYEELSYSSQSVHFDFLIG